MATAHDVAAYILAQRGPMSAMKLQKLCYYSQAWHLVWEDRPLFTDEIQAWANGPVIYPLFISHRGRFQLSKGDIAGDPSVLDDGEKESIGVVLDFYGDYTAHQLSELTHRESPWIDARKGLGPMDRGNAVITDEALFSYYDTLDLVAESR